MPPPSGRTRVQRHPERAVDQPRDPAWAGTLPLRTVVGEPATAPDLRAGIAGPANLGEFRRP